MQVELDGATRHGSHRPAGRTDATPVTVLLSAFNGAAHLAQQLDSIARQGAVDWSLLWRDDGSTDGTVRILRHWSAAQPGRAAELADHAGVRLGGTRSFLALLAAAPGTGHVAFCDQDDVWLPAKLARATAALGRLSSLQPGLYCSRQAIVGPDLAPRGLSPLPPRAVGLRNALVQNVATGCTMVLNAAARALVLAAAPAPAGSFHDWWAYLLVSAAGGSVVFDPEPSLLYRQHGANQVGAEARFIARARGAALRGSGPFLRVFQDHLAALQDSRSLLSAEGVATLDAALRIAAARGPFGRLLALHRAGLYRQRLAEDLLLRFWVARWGGSQG